MTRLACSDVEALAAELALGILPGDERADAVSHLDRCPACQHHVEALALVADELLLAAPEQEPPTGFDGRVLERVAAAARSAPGGAPPRRRRRPLAAAAAAVLLVLASLGGWAAGDRGTGTDADTGNTTAQATTVSVGGGGWICRVAAFAGQGGRPGQLVVRLDEPADTDGWYTVEAEPASGAAPVRVGAITVENGTGELDAAVPHGTGKVRAIRVIGPDGALHYRAAFPAI